MNMCLKEIVFNRFEYFLLTAIYFRLKALHSNKITFRFTVLALSLPPDEFGFAKDKHVILLPIGKFYKILAITMSPVAITN